MGDDDVTIREPRRGDGDGDATRIIRELKREQRANREGSAEDRKKWPAIVQWGISILIAPIMGFIILGYISQERIQVLNKRVDKLETKTISREVLETRNDAIMEWQDTHKDEFKEFKEDTKESLRALWRRNSRNDDN